MRALLVLLVATAARADSSTVTIKNDSLWPSHDKPISVRIGGGAWRKVATNTTSKPLDIKAPADGKIVAIDVQAPTGSKSFRRWAVVLPNMQYRIVGNPCAFWGLDVDVEAADVARLQVDASAIAPKLFPLVISTDLMSDDDEEPSVDAVLEKPGTSAAVELLVSAMCARSGSHVIVYSRATKQRLIDLTLIAHPGAVHTMKLARGSFTVRLAR